MRFFLGILLICSISLNAQVEYSQPLSKDKSKPFFYLDIANYKSNTPDKTRMDVFIQVPYANIQFIKSGETYKGRYSVNLRFMNEDKTNIVSEQIWEEKLELPNFQQTLSRTAFNISHKSFMMAPGKYAGVCFIEDLDSKKTSSLEFTETVRTFTDSLDISDIVFVAQVVKTENGTSIVPNIANRVTSQTKEFPFYFEVYSDKPREVFVEINISELQSGRSFNKMVSKSLQAGKTFIFEQLDNLNFLLGDYQLEVKIKDEKWTDMAVRIKKFKSEFMDLPGSITDLDKAVEQMIYITTTSQLDSIQNATTFEDKLDRFLKFWEAKDPTPNTPNNEALNEYYRRVNYANAHFKSYFEGWKSDMGWIYIILGPPDYVARHPMDIESKPYEIWEYYDVRRTFTFVDETGFGHYRLINPQYGDWFKYRY